MGEVILYYNTQQSYIRYCYYLCVTVMNGLVCFHHRFQVKFTTIWGIIKGLFWPWAKKKATSLLEIALCISF